VVASILKLISVGVSTLSAASAIVITGPLRDGDIAYHLAQCWAAFNLWAFGINVRPRRLAALDPKRPYIFMSNHRSQLDPLAVIAALPDFQLRWVAKKELIDVPVFGWALQRGGHIVIDRSDQRQAITTLRAAREQMLAGVSVVIFPEGTRSSAEQGLLPLKKGGFMLALETGFPIVPVAIRGSHALLPKGSWHIREGDIEVVIGKPIEVAGTTREELMTRVQAFLQEHLDLPAPARSNGRPIAEAM
jgi:1-acyl-sn-glycerol-3-phosphate acyltransferase